MKEWTKKTLLWIVALPVLLLTDSCAVNEEVADGEFENTPAGNFMALWTILDEHYCFFDYKKETLGLDWDEVKSRYSESVLVSMSDKSLFELMSDMVNELNDGHVNLSSVYDQSRNVDWYSRYPRNFSADLREKYLGFDYHVISTGYYYRILEDNIGYLVVENFENKISSSRLNMMFSNMAICNGLIIDVRDNPGGLVSQAEFLASHFTDESVVVGYQRYKTGPGHSDFSKYYENRIDPAESDFRWIKPTVLLANRKCFSSGNEIVLYMKSLENVTVLGDTTGGGGGLPFSSELPNGWTIRFSSAPSYDSDFNDIEHGIAPHIHLDMDETDMQNGIDTYVEAARELINGKLINP